MPRAATNMFVLCEHMQSVIATPFALAPASAQQCGWQQWCRGWGNGNDNQWPCTWPINMALKGFVLCFQFGQWAGRVQFCLGVWVF